MVSIGSYLVPTVTPDGNIAEALLSQAAQQDMCNSSFGFPWSHLWTINDFDWGNIIKISYKNRTLGFVRYELKPQPEVEDPQEIASLQHQLLWINHLEAISGQQRVVEPLGKWLIWYATMVGIEYCSGSSTGALIGLTALPEAKLYYRDKIQMEFLGKTKMPSGEDGYAFQFSKIYAQDFCRRHAQQYGFPRKLY